MSKRKPSGRTNPPERICILVVDAIIDDAEVEICRQRSDGVDRAFSTSMDWPRSERPSEGRLAYSVETIMFGIIAKCFRYVGEPVDIRARLFSKGHVWAIINSVYLEMGGIKNENELWRGSTLISSATHLRLPLQASHFTRGIWIACCPGTNHSNCSQSEINFIAVPARSAAALTISTDSLPREGMQRPVLLEEETYINSDGTPLLRRREI